MIIKYLINKQSTDSNHGGCLCINILEYINNKRLTFRLEVYITLIYLLIYLLNIY
jgi:hypothetical protein